MTKAAGPWEPEPPHEPRDPDPLPWIGIAIAALGLLSYPWVSPFTQGRDLFGIPVILWYLFGVWGLLIVLGALSRTDR
ncbi:hypothetical protein D3C85_1673390 [compost metagenome]